MAKSLAKSRVDLNHLLYYQGNKDKKAEYYLRSAQAKVRDRSDYRRRYYQQNKDKCAEYLARIDDSYQRNYYHQNRDKSAEYRARTDSAMADYHRQYYLQNKDKNTELRISGEMGDYQRGYSLRNNEKTAEYRKRSKDWKVANRQYYRQYSRGKREYYQLYRGNQKSNLSWKTPDLVRSYFDSIAARLNISNFADWYRISKKQMDQYGGTSISTVVALFLCFCCISVCSHR